jgi:putative restriction endonuclease
MTWLREQNVHGGMPEDLYRALRKDPTLVRDVATDLLEAHFAETLHADILAAVGLDLDAAGPPKATDRRPRDPRFRSRVLRVYGRRCCVCGFDARLGDALVGLEAAHIQWHQAGGPSSVDNGLAVCSLHHKLFDRGAFTLRQDGVMEVSEELTGAQATSEWMVQFHGREAGLPSRPTDRPADQFLEWHRAEVFRMPGMWLG